MSTYCMRVICVSRVAPVCCLLHWPLFRPWSRILLLFDKAAAVDIDMLKEIVNQRMSIAGVVAMQACNGSTDFVADEAQL